MKVFSHAVSYLLHPLLMPTLCFIYLLFGVPSISVNFGLYRKVLLISMIFLVTCVVPSLVTIGLWASRLIKDMRLSRKEDRPIPFWITTSCYVVVTIMMWRTSQVLGEVLLKYMVIMSSSVLIVTIISYYQKISAHSVGVAGLSALILYTTFYEYTSTYVWPLVISFLVSGMVMSARIYLNAHRPGEVYQGAVFGFCFNLIAAFVLL